MPQSTKFYLEFKNYKDSDFPLGRSYISQFNTILDYLKRNIYPQINIGALWNEIKSTGDLIYLNDHGIEHVKKVINLSYRILQANNVELSPYEQFLFLISILVHDAGLVNGRNNHEERVRFILYEKLKNSYDDTIEKKIISCIAESHSGSTPDGDKDTIGFQKKIETVYNEDVRVQFLAALLRFSDELADDSERASRFIIEEEELEGSEIFHHYSKSLNTVKIESKNIKLFYHLFTDQLASKYQKIDEEEYLLDEIYYRTMKMHREKVYCNRFLRASGIDIEKITVNIEINDKEKIRSVSHSAPYTEINYEIEEKGYPDIQGNYVFDLVPKLKDKTGEIMCEEIKKYKEDSQNGKSI